MKPTLYSIKKPNVVRSKPLLDLWNSQPFAGSIRLLEMSNSQSFEG